MSFLGLLRGRRGDPIRILCRYCNFAGEISAISRKGCGAQANAVSDKILDLRKCSLKGADLHGKTLSGGLFVESDMSNTNLIEAVLSKAYAVKANFSGAPSSLWCTHAHTQTRLNTVDANHSPVAQRDCRLSCGPICTAHAYTTAFLLDIQFSISVTASCDAVAGADFTNAVVDRVAFDQTDLSGATFTNAVITGGLPTHLSTTTHVRVLP